MFSQNKDKTSTLLAGMFAKTKITHSEAHIQSVSFRGWASTQSGCVYVPLAGEPSQGMELSPSSCSRWNRQCEGHVLVENSFQTKWHSANLSQKAAGWHLRPHLHTLDDAERWRCNKYLHHHKAPRAYSVHRQAWNSLGLKCASLHLLHKCLHYARSHLTPSLAKEGKVWVVQHLMLVSSSWTSSKGQTSQHWA